MFVAKKTIIQPDKNYTMKSNQPSTRNTPKTSSGRAAGFTLIEAIVATFVLTFGLVGIFNLMIVGTSTNALANSSTGATFLAGQQLEILRSTQSSALVDGGSLDTDTAGYFVAPAPLVTGVGTFDVRWTIATVNGIRFIQVRAQPRGFRGRWARAEMTTFRACTTGTASGC